MTSFLTITLIKTLKRRTCNCHTLFLLKRIYVIALSILFFNPQYRGERSERHIQTGCRFSRPLTDTAPPDIPIVYYFPLNIHHPIEQLLKISITFKNSAITRVL